MIFIQTGIDAKEWRNDMGYDTSYTLRAQNISREDFDRLIERLTEMNIIGYALTDDEHFMEFDEGSHQAYIDCNVECHWYEHEGDMVEISKEFSNARFRLSGLGEYRGDIWSSYYKNGEIENCGVIIEEVKPEKIFWEKEVI